MTGRVKKGDDLVNTGEAALRSFARIVGSCVLLVSLVCAVLSLFVSVQSAGILLLRPDMDGIAGVVMGYGLTDWVFVGAWLGLAVAAGAVTVAQAVLVRNCR